MFGVIATPARGVGGVGGGGGGRGDKRDLDVSMSFGDVESFVEPAPKERQDHHRRPLQARTDLNKAEFTPLLRSAKIRHTRALDLATPARGVGVDNSGLTPVSFRGVRLPGNGAVGRDESTLSLQNGRSTGGGGGAARRGDESDVSGAVGEVGGIREQEQHMDKLKKENWELKLKIFLMEKQAFQSSPEHVQLALKENIANKVELASLSKEIQKYKRLLADTEAKVSYLGKEVSQSVLHSSAECPLQHGMSDEERQMVDELRQDKAHFEAERDDLKDQLEQAQRDVDEADEEKARLANEIAELRQAAEDAEAANERLAEVEEVLQGVREEKASLEERLGGMQDALEDLQLEHDTLANKHDELLSQTRSADDNELVAILREQLGERAEEAATLQERIQNLERANVSLEKQATELGAAAQEARAQYDEASIKATTLEIELQNARATEEDARQHVAQLQTALDGQREEAVTLQGQLADQSFELRKLQDRAEHDRSRLPENDRVRALEEDVEILRADKETMGRRIAELEEDLELADERDVERDGEIEALRTELEEAHARQASIKRDLHAARDQLDEERLRQIDQTLGDTTAPNVTLPEITAARQISAENSELRGTVDDLEYAIRQKEDEVVELTDKLARMTEQVEGEAQAAQDARRELGLVRKELEGARQELETVRATVSQREDKARALETSLLNVRGLLADAQAAHKAELQSQAQSHGDVLAKHQSAHGALEARLGAESEAHARQVAELEAAHASAQRSLEATVAQVRSLEGTVRRLGEQEETMNLDHAKWRDALQMEQDRHATKVASLQTEIDELAVARDGAKRELQQRAEDAQRAAEKQREVDAALQERTRACDRLEGDLAAVQEAQKGEASERLKLEKTVAELEDELNLLSADVEAAKAEVSLKEHDLSEARARVAELDAGVRTLEGRLTTAEQEKSRLTLSLAAADARVVQVTKRIEDATTERVRLEGELEAALAAKTADVDADGLPMSRPSSANDSVAESERARLRSELNAVRESLANAQTEISELAAERDLLEEQLDQVSADLEAARGESAATVADLTERVRSTSTALQKEQQDRARAERTAADDLREARDACERVERASRDLEASLGLSRKAHADLKQSTDGELSALKRQVVELELELDAAPAQEIVQRCDTQMRELLTVQRERDTLSKQLDDAFRRADDLAAELADAQSGSRRELESLERDARAKVDRMQAALRGVEERHRLEVAGMRRMLDFVRGQKEREVGRSADLAFIKQFYDRQIASFEACNRANLLIVRRIGISAAATFDEADAVGSRPKRTLAHVAQAVVATVRMRRMADVAHEERVERQRLNRALKDRHR